MTYSFWSNTIWYIILFITSIISFTSALIRSKNRKFIIAFTLAILGFIYLIEAILVIPSNSYAYYPKLSDNSFMDTILGNVFSQVSISTTFALIAAYDLSYKWYFIFAIIYYFIEELFLKLGIYQHFWYKSVYTLIGFIALFWFLRMWYVKLISSSKYFIHYITLFLSTFAAITHTIIMPLRLLRIQIFTVNFYGEFAENHTTTGIIYAFFLINILILLYLSKINFSYKAMILVILFFVQYTLYKFGFIDIKRGWLYPVILLDLSGTYLWIAVLNRFLKEKPHI